MVSVASSVPLVSVPVMPPRRAALLTVPSGATLPRIPPSVKLLPRTRAVADDPILRQRAPLSAPASTVPL